jgi:hypothetical protein
MKCGLLSDLAKIQTKNIFYLLLIFVYCVVAVLRFSLRMGMAMSYIYLILA